MSYTRDPLVYTWLFLSSATLFSWWLGSENDGKTHHQASLWITLAVLLIAIIKCRFVIRNYMEVRVAPSWLQWTCDAWLLLNFAMVSSFYWFRA